MPKKKIINVLNAVRENMVGQTVLTPEEENLVDRIDEILEEIE